MSKSGVILAIDQGTTGTTTMIVNHSLKVLGSHNVEYRQIYPRPGWVEHSLSDIWDSTLKSIKMTLSKAKVSGKRIECIGITNQRETVCFWSRKSGKPLANAIVWQDRRTAAFCEHLKAKGLEATITKKTGLLIDPYFSATKIKWALDNNAAVKSAERKGDLAVGTIDSYLIHKLTNGKAHATEPSNACRTLLYNIETLQWDDELLKVFGVSSAILPHVLNSADNFGQTQSVMGLPDGIPICGVLGDQQSALLGQACVTPGTAKCTYGTGSFILLNTGTEIRRSTHRQLSTIAWKFENITHYALEGGAFTAGAAIQWVRDGLGLIRNPEEIEKLASKVKTSDGVVFIPAFVGLGAPHWAPSARASFSGITRGTNKYHLCRAVLEGISLMNHDILRAMEQDMKEPLKSLNVDGGASRNDLLMQIQANILGIKLIRPKMTETTAMGAVFAAGIGSRVWNSLEQVNRAWKRDKIFSPTIAKMPKQLLLKNWEDAVHRLIK